MNKICAILSLMATLAFSPSLYADTFDGTTNTLTIPSLLVGTATYTNIVVNLGSDYKVVQAINSGSPTLSLNTVTPAAPASFDSYDAFNKLLSIPFVNVKTLTGCDLLNLPRL